jgi:hypothetical protein
MCGRSPGQIVQARFVRDRSEAPPRSQRGAARCGACGGNLYLEVEPPVPPAAAVHLIEQAPDARGSRTDPVR